MASGNVSHASVVAVKVALVPPMLSVAFVLVLQPGEVLSRTRILDHVWDTAYDGDSNVVDVYVRYLREKVDRPFGLSSLETVRGAGYRLSACARP